MFKKQKNKLNILIIILLIILISLWWIVYAFEFLKASWTDNDNRNIKDIYKTSFSNSKLNLTDRGSSEYLWGNWERFKIIQNVSDYETESGSGFVVSDQYGDLYISWAILARKDNILNWSHCSWESVSYTLKWELYSYFWWDFPIKSTDSYYCPESKKLKIVLDWITTKKLTLNWLWNSNTLTWIIDARWNKKEIATSELFSSNKISINWVVSLKTTSWAVNELWNLAWDSSINNKFVVIESKVEWKMAKFNQVINKNIVKLTKWISVIKNNMQLNSISDNIYYYNFEWENALDINNNKWKILPLWSWVSAPIEIDWEKTLILKWWNLYIKSNIYNKNDKNSILTIIVKRDKTNRRNWWNIYIDPNVTNIDAILIADWSILSYDWSSILNSSVQSDVNKLRKQLLIYGSLSTKNTIWDNTAIYWTDDYIKNWWTSSPSKLYNLQNLRTFQIMQSENDSSWDCSDGFKFVAKYSDTVAEEYAFAWRKKCYYSDEWDWMLRTTEKVASIVLEKNQYINIINPKILRP